MYILQIMWLIPLDMYMHSTMTRCQVMTEKELLDTACEQFLGKSVNHICQVILQTLEGHLRAILGTLMSLSLWYAVLPWCMHMYMYICKIVM